MAASWWWKCGASVLKQLVLWPPVKINFILDQASLAEASVSPALHQRPLSLSFTFSSLHPSICMPSLGLIVIFLCCFCIITVFSWFFVSVVHLYFFYFFLCCLYFWVNGNIFWSQMGFFVNDFHNLLLLLMFHGFSFENFWKVVYKCFISIVFKDYFF